MTTMSYLKDDQSHLNSYAIEAFNRRKQLCPFPLEPDDIIDVMHGPHIAALIRELRVIRPKALHWDKGATLILPTGDERVAFIRVSLDSTMPIPLAVDHGGPPELYSTNSTNSTNSKYQSAAEVDCYAGPTTRRLMDWVWKATQVELENRWARSIVRKLVHNTSTHQQVHRYMPELYSLLSNQQEATVNANAWGGRRIVDVYRELQQIGSTRATRIELKDVTIRDRANLKTMVVQTLLLPVHDGLGPDTVFNKTWVDIPRKK